MNLFTVGHNRRVKYGPSRMLFLFLVFGVLSGLFYPSAESLGQTVYPEYVMYMHSSSRMADSLYEEGMRLYNARKYDSSATFLNRAFKMYDSMGDRGHRLQSLAQLTATYAITRKVKMAKGYIKLFLNAMDDTTDIDRKRIVYCTYQLANIYEIVGEYHDGMRFIQKAEQLYKNSTINDKWLHGRIYYVMGALENDFSFNDRAMKCVEKSLKLSENQPREDMKILKVDSYNSLGIFSYREGKYEAAFDYLKKEVDNIQDHPEWKNMSERLLGAYINIGNTLFSTGDNHTALSYYQKALRMVNEGVGETATDEELILNNIGATYWQMGEMQNALQYFLKTVPFKIKELGPDHPDVAIAYVNIGSTYQSLKEDNKAKEYLNKALAIREKVFGPDNPKTLDVYNYLALVYKDQKKYDAALRYLKKNLTVYRAVLGLHHPETAEAFAGIADIYRAMGDYPKALANYQMALQALVPNFHSSDIAANPELDHILSEVEFQNVLERKAGTLLEASKKDEQLARRYIPIAVQTYDTTIRFIKKLRDSYQEESSKYLLSKDTYSIYSGAIEACMLGYKLFGNDTYRKEAFDFSEYSKASILMQSIEDAKAQKYSGIPASLLRREKKLRSAITQYTRDIDQKTSDEKHNDSLEIGKLQDKLFTTRQHFNAFIASLEKKYPSYYELKYRTPHLSVSDIMKKLNVNQAYLDYFVGDSTIYTFEITRDNFTVLCNRVDSASFSKKLEDFRKAIVDADWQSYTRIGYQLYQKLLGPVKDHITGKELLIVPDAQLSLVPFDALLTEKTSNIRSGDYASLPYLIKKHAVMYGYSSYLIFRKRSKEMVQSSGFLGMAPVFDQTADTLSVFKKLTKTNTIPPLMSSLEEVKGIYKVISANPVMKADSHIYLRSQATEAKLKSPEISKYRYIHLATHAYVNEKKPGLSGILFYPAKKDSDDDGILYTGDIYNLNLNARLVVLSACETATGQMVRGEGIIGFSRAFLYAGAKNVIVSIWNVSDRSSPDLMIKFYRHLMVNEDVAHSLQQAKIEMIQEKRYSMPVYWASMIQIR